MSVLTDGASFGVCALQQNFLSTEQLRAKTFTEIMLLRGSVFRHVCQMYLSVSELDQLVKKISLVTAAGSSATGTGIGSELDSSTEQASPAGTTQPQQRNRNSMSSSSKALDSGTNIGAVVTIDEGSATSDGQNEIENEAQKMAVARARFEAHGMAPFSESTPDSVGDGDALGSEDDSHKRDRCNVECAKANDTEATAAPVAEPGAKLLLEQAEPEYFGIDPLDVTDALLSRPPDAVHQEAEPRSGKYAAARGSWFHFWGCLGCWGCNEERPSSRLDSQQSARSSSNSVESTDDQLQRMREILFPPDSHFRTFWELLLFAGLSFYLMSCGLLLAAMLRQKFFQHYYTLLTVCYVVDIVFFIDIILNATVFGYFDSGAVI